MKKALTLVEIIIYLGILSLILLPLSFGFFRIYLNWQILKKYQELNQVANFFVLKLEKEIKSAREISFPEVSQKAPKLSLIDFSNSQIDIFLDSGKVIFEKNGEKEELFFKTFPFLNLNFFNIEGKGVKVEFEIGFEEKGKVLSQFFTTTFNLPPKSL